MRKNTNSKVSLAKIDNREYFVRGKGLVVWRDDMGNWCIDAGDLSGIPGSRCKSPKKQFNTMREAKEYIEKHKLRGCYRMEGK